MDIIGLGVAALCLLLPALAVIGTVLYVFVARPQLRRALGQR